MSVIAWQMEYLFPGSAGGATGLIEFIPAFAGLEHELGHISLNVLMGLRSTTDWEVATGPYLSRTGFGLTLAVGKTFRVGEMRMPINLGYTSTKEDGHVSLTFGWNL